MKLKIWSVLKEQMRVSNSMRVALGLFILVVAFQNCSPGFTVADLGASSLGTNADGTPMDPQTQPTPKLGLTVTNVSAKQTTDLVFRATLGAVQSQDVALEIMTVDGTAVAGVDYVAVSPALSFGKLTIPAGAMTATFTVPSRSVNVLVGNKELSVKVTATMLGVVETSTAKGILTPAFGTPKFKKVSAGWYFGCGITMTDTVACWGENYSGGFGIDPKERAGLVEIAGLAGVKDVQAGDGQVCVITATDTVKCWGRTGRLGDGTANPSKIPVDVVGLAGIKQISLIGSHACALDMAGAVKCWGYNGSGQVGDGTKNDALSPVAVPGLIGVKSVSAGNENTCVIAADDSVKCWGTNQYGQIGNGQADTQNAVLTPTTVSGLRAKAISVGNVNACAIALDGTVSCWGYTGYVAGTYTYDSSPVLVAGITNPKSLSNNLNSMCVLTAQNGVTCWGASFFDSSVNQTPAPLPIVPAGLTTSSMSVGVQFVCALASDNTLRCVGRVPSAEFQNFASVVGAESSGLQGFKQIDVSSHVSCGVTAQDTVKCWTENLNGVFGAVSPKYSDVPILVGGLSAIKSVAVGYSHACALTLDGKVKCWGNNSGGQIGNGVMDPNPVLTPVDLGLTGVKAIAANSRNTCAITATDTVVCWGGVDTNNVIITSPQPVAGLTGIKNISLGEWGHACALTATDTVKCWGSNNFGQVGQDPTVGNYLAAATDVPGLTGVKSLALASYTSCALLATGTVKCWGYNSSGELGIGSTSMGNYVPGEVPGLAGVAQLAAANQLCALLTNSSVKCWGYAPDQTIRATPTEVIFGQKITSLWPSFYSLAASDSFGRMFMIGKAGPISVNATLMLTSLP